MIFGKTKLELKVGIFVFVALVILVVFVLLIGDFKVWTSGYAVNFRFNFINGVKIGAPVRFSGVDVGEVKNIDFIPLPEENKIQVEIVGWIDKKVKIPADSTVWVNTLGLLGEKYIEIIPGKDFSNYLKENQSLAGTDPIAMHEVAELAKSIAGNISESFAKINNQEGTIGKLLYDDAIYKELLATSEGIEALVSDIRKHPWKLFRKTKEKPEKK